MQTNCARCTEKQKVTAYLAIRRLKKEYPTIWQKMQALWDPSGELVSRFINDVETKSNLEGIVKVGSGSNTNSDTVVPQQQEQQKPQQQQQPNQQQDLIDNKVPENIFNRFGEETTDNEINTGASVATNQITITQTYTPYGLPLQGAQAIPNIQSVTASNNQKNSNQIASFAPQALPYGPAGGAAAAAIPITTTTNPTTTERVPTTTFLNYRTSTRRIVIIPRPIDLGRLTVNVFAQVADVGSKVIRTGARIADMVLRPIFNNNNTNNNRN